ncbi:MAG TPA: tetratricopeptide repeat protein [Alphaproteobacteria bacterium]|nr:tetratricopeptide repeat protein [Alphaproteobacteria bacterium]
MERSLAAVMIADVAGYGRLSQVDEEGTRLRFHADLHDIFEPEISRHHGRLVKTMGDGLLVEFHSVVDALRCAVAIQRAKTERNAGQSADHRLDFRIGINLGDVIMEGGDIHGDGVNIADRLQALAEPGGITVSGTAYDHVKTKLDVGYEFRGEQQVKNIAEPIRVYRVLTDPAVAGKTIEAPRSAPMSWRSVASAAVLVLAVAIGVVIWLRPWEPTFQPQIPLPDKPSIAVLPFANLSDDPEQEYFADGMADDLITDLSRVSGLFVIARNSTFAYKGKSVDLRQVARELGVRYVLEGSVRRSGNQLRINAQLIDASTGGHRWAERYDGSLAEIFVLQDKITNAIVDALALRLAGSAQGLEPETAIPAAYDAFLRGRDHFRHTTREDYAKAIPFFEEATRLDPNYGRAYAALAMVYIGAYYARWNDRLGITRQDARIRARRYLQEAQKRPTALAHQAAGSVLMTEWQHTAALAEFKEAIALEPGEPWGYALMAWTLTSAGRPAEALAHIQTAIRLDPHSPPFFGFVLGLAEFSLEKFEQAAATLETSTKLNPDFESAFLLLGATYGQLGRNEDAQSAIARYDEIMIGRGNVPLTVSSRPALDLSKEPYRSRLRDGLRLAGVPETLSAGEFGAENRLTIEEVRSLIIGRKLHGRTFDTGEEHAATVTADGIATLSGDWASLGGGIMAGSVVKLENDELCFLWQGAVKFCGAAFRNPGGSRAVENEFIWYQGDRAYTFSVAD